MNSRSSGIGRLAPLLVASLLLHLAVILAAMGPGRRDATPPGKTAWLDMVFQTGGDDRKRDHAPLKRQTVPELPPRSATEPSAALPAPSAAQAPAAGGPVRPAAPLPVPGAVPVMTSGGGRAPLSTGAAALPNGSVSGPAAARAEAASPGTTPGRGAYQALLKSIIEAHKEYPLAARTWGREGSCQRRFVLGRNGLLKRVESLSSCGHPFLDEAATRAITAVGTFPPLPDDFRGSEEAFTVTMTFTLTRQ